MKKITASRAFSRAWEIFKNNPIQHIGVFFLAMFIIGIFNSLANPNMSAMFMRSGMDNLANTPTPHVSPFWSIVNFIIQAIVYLFLLGYTLDVVRNNYKGFNQIFSKYVTLKLFLYYFIFSILIGLIAIILLLPGFMMMLSKSGSGGIIFFIGFIVFFYIIIRLMFTSYLFLDGHDFADALKISWQKTRPYIGELLLLIIMALLVIFLGLIALIIGVFIAIPVVYFAQAVFYNEAISDEAPQSEVPSGLE